MPYHNGEILVDVALGHMGPHDDRSVGPDSLFCGFAATKGVAALAVHQLADRGQLDLEAPVARYWPAFGRQDKGTITVAQAMSHQAGLHAMPEPFRLEHLTDWDAGIVRMEQATPAWEPGTATAYHAITYGWIAGGIVAGATGRHVQDVIRTEIAEPLGVADEFFVGIPDDPSVYDRLATIAVAPPAIGSAIPADADVHKAIPSGLWAHVNEREFLRACLPSGNGVFSARALARMYGALADGGAIDGVRLVGAGQIVAMQRLRTDQVDRVLGIPLRKDTGFFLGGTSYSQGKVVHGPIGPRETAFGNAGAGGAIGFADPEIGLGMAVMVNKMAYPPPGTGATQEICDLIRRLCQDNPR